MSRGRVDHLIFAVCEVLNGSVVRVHPYFSWAEALEAAGLAE
jgi:hypothetical protein